MSLTNRRNFIRQSGSLAAAFSLPALSRANNAGFNLVNKAINPPTTMNDADFWSWVKESYTTSSTLINLNNGGVSPQPKVVQDAQARYLQLCNEAPSYYMWRILDQGRESLRTKLADLAGCNSEEIAINRNATEALNTLIFGLNLKAGDEVVLTKQDYPNMVNAWKQREKRDGVVLKFINLELPVDDDDKIVELFNQQITAKTRIVMVTHVINWTGQILPVKRIADLAHKNGAEVIVDGAHSFAQLNFKISDLHADYFGTSLHKWLSAPFGSGLLYIKKEKIKNVWALLSSNKPDGDDIRKFETIGTRSFASEMAIAQAVDFHLAIGSQRKEDRLRALKMYWVDQVKHLKKVKFSTSILANKSCAICCFLIEGFTPSELEAKLLDKYKIHTSPIVYENISGVRVTPNVYTSFFDLDRLIKAVHDLCEEK